MQTTTNQNDDDELFDISYEEDEQWLEADGTMVWKPGRARKSHKEPEYLADDTRPF